MAAGLRFPEGPVALPGGDVAVVEIAAGRVSRVRPDGQVATLAVTGGGPNGLAPGPGGRLYCCNNGGFAWTERGGRLVPAGQPADYAGGRIEVIDADTGRVEVMYADGDQGCSLRGPNDLVFDAHGGFWFTDHGKTRERERDRTGVFYAAADGSRLVEAIFPLENPNGIGLSPDGATLYVAETYTCRLLAFPVTAPGQVGRPVTLCRPAGDKWFDSLGVEADGTVGVATVGVGGITRVAPDGREVGFVPAPDRFTTNICWGGADGADAFVTLSATGRLARARWPGPGLKLAHA